MTEVRIQLVPAPDLTVHQLHEIWRIRDQVFMVEQGSTEPDVDGADLDPSCTHAWVADADGQLRSYARAYPEDGSLRIGRVATRVEDRGLGLAGAVLDRLLEVAEGRTVTLHAQSHLADWYALRGFVVTGPGFLEAGIRHVPMRRDA